MRIKKQVFITLISVVVGALLVGAGTFAYFNDTATSTNNEFKTGTIDIGKGGSIRESTILAVDNAKPGDKFGGTYVVKNTGSLDADLSFVLNLPVDEKGLSTQLVIDSITYVKDNGTPVTANVVAGTTLNALIGQKVDIGDIAANGGIVTMKVNGHFIYSDQDQNVYQNAKVNGIFTFTAAQKAPNVR